jgi:uncharacterized protein (DUF1015 family)
MNIYPFKAHYPNQQLISSPDKFFNTVSAEYIQYKEGGFFVSARNKSMYIYRIDGPDYKHTGLIVSNDISDLDGGHIMGHENTLAHKEQVMTNLLLARKAMIKPVLLGYHGHPEIDDFILRFTEKHSPFLEFYLEEKSEYHRFWAIDDAHDIDTLQQLFRKLIPYSYIADGHHRAKITSKLVKMNYLKEKDDEQHPGLLCAIFPFSDLKIYDFNRIVDYSEMKSPARFIAELSRYFDIKHSKKAVKPVKKHQITLNLRNEWFKLTWKSSVLASYKNHDVVFDVDIFNEKILKKILKIGDIKTSDRVKYVEGVMDLNSIILKMTDPMQCLFCMYPIDAEDIVKASNLKLVLPPKSTWFEPRILNGMLVKEF